MKKILLIMIGLSISLMADFVRDANSSIVTDNTTGLQWQDNIQPHAKTWKDAINYCESLQLGGMNDWRLPNFNELNSLVNDNVYDPSISSIFVNTISNYYWSSTTSAIDTDYAWIVFFYNGDQDYSFKTDKSYIMCVRAGR